MDLSQVILDKLFFIKGVVVLPYGLMAPSMGSQHYPSLLAFSAPCLWALGTFPPTNLMKIFISNGKKICPISFYFLSTFGGWVRTKCEWIHLRNGKKTLSPKSAKKWSSFRKQVLMYQVVPSYELIVITVLMN